MRTSSTFRATLAVLTIACLPLLAQQTGITGRVTDPSAGLIATVHITATADDGSKVQTTTNSQGLYQLPALRAGMFVVV